MNPFRFWRCRQQFIGLWVLLFMLPGYAQTAPESVTLSLNQTLESPLAGGQRQSYRLTLTKDVYVEAWLEQQGVDVAVTVSGPDGKPLAQFDNDPRPQGRELLTFIAAAEGNYGLNVEARAKNAPAGRFTLTLKAARPATGNDRAAQEARQLSADALRLAGTGKLNEAVPLAERALTLREQALSADHPEIPLSLQRLATLYRDRGEAAKAEPLYRRALTLAEAVPPPGHQELAAIYNDLGGLYLTQGDLAKAETNLQRAQTIWEETLGPNHPNVARALTNLGRIYAVRGDRPRARQSLQRAQTIREQALGMEHPQLLNTLVGLGNLAYEDGEYEQAEELYQRTLKIVDKTPGQENPGTAGVLNNLAAIRAFRRDFAQAETLYRRVQTIREKLLGPEHTDVAQAINNIASLYVNQRQADKALPLHQRALAMREQALGATHPDVGYVLNTLARAYVVNGAFADAVATQTRANATSERNLSHNLAVGSERQKLAYLATLARETDRTISLHLRLAPQNEAARDLALTTILQRKGRALDALTDSVAALRQQASAEDKTLLEQWQQTRTQLARLALTGPQRTPRAEYQTRLQTLETQREKLEDEISRRSAAFRVLTQPPTLAAVQAAVPARAALVEFAIFRDYKPDYAGIDEEFGPPRYAAYVLTAQGAPRFVDLGPSAPIDEAVQKLRESMRDRQRRDYARLARAVERLVMQPVRPLFGQKRHLILAPDGLLNLVPFAALVDGRGNYLVKRYAISYVTSGRDLVRLQAKRPPRQTALVVAAPDFGDEAAAGAQRVLKYKALATPTSSGSVLAEATFPPLPGTAGEADGLKKLWPTATILLNAQATETALKQADGPTLLHIATHGFFLDQVAQDKQRGTRAITDADPAVPLGNPLLRSGLALTGANKLKGSATDDGILTSLEAAALDLNGTQLVVLSACDTGVGEIVNGEGVYGLRRALVLAGAESQVLTLWPVADLATRDLMLDFYRRLQRGVGRTEALRQAQLRLLTRPAGARNYRHPYYWASFIQSGDWAALNAAEPAAPAK